MNATSGKISHLPLHALHKDLGARFGIFGDWEVPLYYSSIIEEHQAVRTAAGIFDISHMGEIFVSGSRAVSFLDDVLPRRIATMPIEKALYMPLLNESGGIVDDLIVYRLDEAEFMIITNAGNIEKDYEWIRSHLGPGVKLDNRSSEFGLIALQGPAASAILSRIIEPEFVPQKYYHFKPWKGESLVARTGYTGEDGFEIMVPYPELEKLWREILNEGQSKGLRPIGFGARDTLRLEAGMPLYDHELTDATSPLEVNLHWAVDLTKDYFIGRDVLLKLVSKGFVHRLVGFCMEDRGIPRHGCEIVYKNKRVGQVTSGSFSPTLKKSIGMAFVKTAELVEGTEIDVLIRAQQQRARIVKLPFYSRKKG